MTASWRTTLALAVLAAIALVLAILDGRGGAAVVDRAIVPGFDPARATSVAWRGGDRIERGSTGWVAASGVPLDRATVDGVLAALRGGRWQRRGAIAAAGAIVTTLEVDLGGGAGARSLGIGQPLAGAEQTWIVRDGGAVVVDDWIARALDVAPWQLHERHPLAAIDDAPRTTIAFAGEPPVVIEAHARRAETWLDPAPVAAFEDAARSLAIVGPPEPTTAASPPGALTIELGAAKLVVLGPCAHTPATTQIAGTVAGCVDRAALATLVAAARTLAGPLDPIRDLRPLPAAAPATATIVLGASGRLVLDRPAHVELAAASNTPQTLDQTLDPAELAQLLAALAAPGALVGPPPATPPVLATIAIGPVALALHAPDVVVRDGTALRVDPAAFAVLARPASAYVDRVLWAEDPVTVARVAIDGHVFTRGAVLGEWSRDGAPARPAAAVEAYVAQLAHARAIDGPTGPAHAHHVELTIITPARTTTAHALDLGAPTATSCPARIAPARDIVLPRADCLPPP